MFDMFPTIHLSALGVVTILFTTLGVGLLEFCMDLETYLCYILSLLCASRHKASVFQRRVGVGFPSAVSNVNSMLTCTKHGVFWRRRDRRPHNDRRRDSWRRYSECSMATRRSSTKFAVFWRRRDACLRFASIVLMVSWGFYWLHL
jgi:hypothetical protein